MSISAGVGAKLLRLLTAGMYDNPLVIFGEYVQNAADSIAHTGGKGYIHISVDPVKSCISIRDNGTGLASQNAIRQLVDVGRSTKDPTVDRGFRGIGRLSGLAFAEKVHFTTRTKSTDAPTQVTWDGRILRSLNLSNIDAAVAIEQCTTVTRLAEGDWPDHFFEVTVERVNRHAATALLNENAVRDYLSETAPVPFQSRFTLADQIREFLNSYVDEFVIDIRVNNDSQPITRPYAEAIQLTDHFSAPYEYLDTRVIPQSDNDSPAAVFWLAHTPYAGAIPKRLAVRGIRARIGNLQVGDERIFEHLFPEPRFNSWCVGEVHILDGRIVPNGKRQYFESGPHLRNLENHVGAIAQQITVLCRQASSQRNKLRHIDAEINRIGCAPQLACSGYLRLVDSEALLERERARLPSIRHTLTQLQSLDHDDSRYDLTQFEHQLDEPSAKPNPQLEAVSPRFIPHLQTVFATIAETMPPPSALNLIESVIDRLVAGERSPKKE